MVGFVISQSYCVLDYIYIINSNAQSFTYMSPKFAPQKVASIVKLFVIPIWRHITTRAVDSLHLRTRNLHPLNENLSGAWGNENKKKKL